MTDIVSKISGQFNKSLLLGAFLPTAVFIILGMLLLAPILPAGWPAFAPLEALGTEWKVIGVSILTLILSGLLYNLNTPIVRFYSGYPWLKSWFGQRRVRHYQAQLRFAQSRFQGYRALVYAQRKASKTKATENAYKTAKDADKTDAGKAKEGQEINVIPATATVQVKPEKAREPGLRWWRSAAKAQAENADTPEAEAKNNAEIERYWGAIGRRLNAEYPGLEDLVMPTRVGNIIRSFDYYSVNQYGIDASDMWPRLIAKIDKDFAAAIDEAKTAFDFFINGSVLSALLSLALLVTGLLHPIPFTAAQSLFWWLAEIGSMAALSYLSYKASLPGAKIWGNMVKAAIDLYRGDLLKQLGYKQLPDTLLQERDLWKDVSRQIMYGDAPRRLPAIYTDKPSLARTTMSIVQEADGSEKNGIELPVFRAVSLLSSGKIYVTLTIRNDGDQAAHQVRVTDPIPDGYDYVWDSNLPQFLDSDGAGAPSITIRVTGINPMKFDIGDLEAHKAKAFCYAIAKRA